MQETTVRNFVLKSWQCTITSAPTPRTAGISRCLFETYFTLDAAEPVKRSVLDCLIGVARDAAPGQGLEPLGAALVRRAAETGDSQAAYFLSLVPPTVCCTGRNCRGQWRDSQRILVRCYTAPCLLSGACETDDQRARSPERRRARVEFLPFSSLPPKAVRRREG